MKSLLVFLALLSLSRAGVPVPRGLDDRIINGHDAKVGEIPYQVSLQIRSSSFHFCGGSVLNQNYVITAAHCVRNKFPYEIKVIAGSLELMHPQSTHLAVKLIAHEHYNPMGSYKNDIGLIKVREAFIVSKTVNYVPLPEQGQSIPANAAAVVSGWGRLWEGGATPLKLQLAEILITPQEYCADVYSKKGYTIYSTHICANDPNVETGSCHGDSGGPLTVNGKLVGLVSWAVGCAKRDLPTVFTRVSEYIDWINANAV